MDDKELDDRRTWTRPLRQVPDVVLVHLSDIHFKATDEGIDDRNKDLRNEVLLDLRRQRTHLHRYHLLVVTGDIAYSGKRDEFLIAAKWLDVLREQLGVPAGNVLVTPGNHDVDRAVADSAEVAPLRSEIRACNGEDLQATFSRMISHNSIHLLKSIQEFNVFAEGLGCAVQRDRLCWTRNVILSDGSTLRIRGLTSTILSGSEDNDREMRMVLGELQCALEREHGVEYLTLAHHPPSWLLDHDAATRLLNSRARVQLYGHKHEQWIEPSGIGVRVVAGAVHPERKESKWVPRYNVLTLTARRTEDGRYLDVIVYARRWSEEETCFIPDCDSKLLPVRLFSFRLDNWQPAGDGTQVPVESDVPRLGLTQDEFRDLRYRLAMLPVEIQVRVAERLDLLGRGGLARDSVPFDRKLLEVATEKMQQLVTLVDLYHGELNRSAGPQGSRFGQGGAHA